MDSGKGFLSNSVSLKEALQILQIPAEARTFPQTSALLSYLRPLLYFQSLEQSAGFSVQLDTISSLSYKFFQAKSTVLDKHKTSPYVYIVIDGRCALYTDTSNRLAEYTQGLSFSSGSLYIKNCSNPSIIAEEDTHIVIQKEHEKKKQKQLTEEEKIHIVKEVLNKLPGFKPKGFKYCQKIFGLFREIRLRSGEFLYKENEIASSLYFTLTGEIKLSKVVSLYKPISLNSHKKVNSTSHIAFVGPKECIGEDDAILKTTRSHSAFCFSETAILLEINVDDFLKKIADDTLYKLLVNRAGIKKKWREQLKNPMKISEEHKIIESKRRMNLSLSPKSSETKLPKIMDKKNSIPVFQHSNLLSKTRVKVPVNIHTAALRETRNSLPKKIFRPKIEIPRGDHLQLVIKNLNKFKYI